MRRAALAATAALALLGTAACGGDDDITDPLGGTPNGLSTTAARYLSSALDFMEDVFLYRSRVNWTQVRSDALAAVPGAQTTAQTYPGIRVAIGRLNDRHSGFWEPQSAPGRVDAPPANPLYLAAGRPSGRLAYLYVPTFTGRNPVGRADSILAVVRQLDQDAPCGWILDLRNNPGGYWAAMIAGINPLLGDGRFGGLVDADSARAFFYSTGASVGVVQDAPRDSLEYLRAGSTFRLRRPNAPVAILQGPQTASAGELIILAFRGPNRPPMRAFGAATYGVTTVPVGAYLPPDSAFLNITAAVMFDGNRRVYGDAIAPDEVVAGPTTANPNVDDAVVGAARAWLLARPECAAAAAAPAPLASRAPLDVVPGRPGWARSAPRLDRIPSGGALPVSPVFGGGRLLH